MTLSPRPGISKISPYVGGRASVGGLARVFKLSSNESPLGPSPAAREAFERSAENLEIYPEGSARLLREAIAEAHGLHPERIVCGNGSDELLTLLANAYLRPGDEVLFSQHGFLVYRIATLANSAVPIAVGERDLHCDVDAMLAAVNGRTRLVYIANPNNPTGSYLSSQELRRLHHGLPEHVLLVIDAAYAEYVRRNDYESGIELVSQFDNVVMTRTFSKIYGLAGLRVGWAFCPAEVVATLNRIRGPFNVSVPAQAAAAAAVRDRTHLERALAHNDKWLSWLTRELRELGLRVDDSAGNFLLLHFGTEGPFTADKADQFLSHRGLILRAVANYDLPHCLRLTVGSEEANRLVVEALRTFLGKAA